MKNKRFFTTLFLLLSLNAMPVIAQSDKKAESKTKAWAQEPSSILGLKIGAPLSQSDLPSCSLDRKAGDSVVCISEKPSPIPGYPSLRTIEGHPFGYAVFSIRLDDTGAVSAITAQMEQDRFAEFIAVLKEKYGAPTNSYSSEVQSRAGSSYPYTRLRWTGKKVSISALERFESIDRSAIFFIDNASNDSSVQKNIGATKANASKL